MNDDDLRRLLLNSLSDRRMPEDARARLFSRLRRRPWRWAAGAVAAAAVVVVAGASFLLRPGPALPAKVRVAFDHHVQSDVKEHAISSATALEVSERVRDAIGREVQVPGLQDAGFPQRQGGRCSATGDAHVIYQNSWNRLSCFIFEADALPDVGERIADRGVEGTVFRRGHTSGVAVREGGVVKLWVADLRPEQVAAIAFDAEQKRYQLKTAVFAVTSEANRRPVETILAGTPGVEQVQRAPDKAECVVLYDPRRISREEMAAVLIRSDMDVTPMGGGND